MWKLPNSKAKLLHNPCECCWLATLKDWCSDVGVKTALGVIGGAHASLSRAVTTGGASVNCQ